jgi:predicted O-linked N-acetylglucosamine transferase (SPINDLY family)
VNVVSYANAIERSKKRDFSVSELIAIADNLASQGRSRDVAELYRVWLDHNADHPLVYAVLFNQGVVLGNLEDLEGARKVLSTAIEKFPDFYPPYINLGRIMERMGARGDAVQTWYTLVNRLGSINGENLNFKISGLKQIGRVLEAGNIDEKAEEALKFALDLNPEQRDVLQHWCSLRQRQCKWPVMTGWAEVSRETLLNGISPLSLAAYTDDPLLQLGNAAIYNRFEAGKYHPTLVDGHQPEVRNRRGSRRLRVGYLSSDLREHAIGYLTQELWEVHDPSTVDVSLYYCGHEVNDVVHTRIKACGKPWFNVTGLTDDQAAQRIMDDEIDILIDVNGYTHSARTKMLAMRPAPIVVNWLGYPGTMGSPYHHYIISDNYIIPPESEMYYTEKVVRLPCYQPNDRKRIVHPLTSTRTEAGLPEDGTVFCCFNGVHKITSFHWERWMSILKQVPGSVLWLLQGAEESNARLRALAAQHGVAPERIVFAQKLRNPDHLARYQHADLFLDTTPYGAHTTASDAMWMGIPVLTLEGRGFASRVCGSLVSAAGMPDMICPDSESYVARAVELGKDRQALAALKKRMRDNRDSCVLFDTTLLARSMEKLFEEMWADLESGNLPRPDLRNVEIYNDIGVSLDKNDLEMGSVKDYQALYLDEMKKRDAYAPIPFDNRLWRGPVE